MAEKRVALISGANRGIGLEAGRQLARKGVHVVLGSRDPEKGKEAARSITGEGLEAETVRLDVADGLSVAAAVEEIARRHGRIDILLNNAAILIDGPGGFRSSLFELKADTARQTFETNVLGPLRLTQAVVPIMQRNGYGRIVNLSSGAGQLSDMRSGFPAYRLSKAALNALTRITAAELASTNIKVNAVCPGWVRTDMGGAEAERPVEVGAETPVWLATLPENGPTGGFFRDMRAIPW
ncbi:MAG: SDR family oxidoreductase [Verrucomicrobia bacterium]|jgi:NAD(P)-dependent dehydrogenase (short-subunit alcohol dehydrogenase family)|nr:SDR family oxidoreductase [Verrucomicrobiota bacterium]